MEPQPTKPILQVSKRIIDLRGSGIKKEIDGYLRLNFLFQIAKSYSFIHPNLSSHFLRQFIEVAEKKVIRMQNSANCRNTTLKRQYCKPCAAFYSHRKIFRQKNNKIIVMNTCSICRRKKKYVSYSRLFRAKQLQHIKEQ